MGLIENLNSIQGDTNEEFNGTISTHQQNVLLAVLEERIEVATTVISDTEQGFSAFRDEIGDIVKGTLGTLTSEGSLSTEEGQQISQDYSEQNMTLLKNFTDIKKKQLKRLNERMIEKKKHKLSQLRERQGVERSKVIIQGLFITYTCDTKSSSQGDQLTMKAASVGQL